MHLLVTQLNLQFSEWFKYIKEYSSTIRGQLQKLPEIISTTLCILWEFQSFRLITYIFSFASAIPIVLLLFMNLAIVFVTAMLHGTLWISCTSIAIGLSFLFLLPIMVSSAFLSSIFMVAHAWLYSVKNNYIEKYPKYGVHNGEVVKY